MTESDLSNETRTDAEEGSYELERSDVAAILDAVERGDQAQLTQRMEPLHPADIADLLEQISTSERRRLIHLYDREFDGEILSELDESIRDEVIATLRPEVLADAVRELESDDVVDEYTPFDDGSTSFFGGGQRGVRALAQNGVNLGEINATGKVTDDGH